MDGATELPMEGRQRRITFSSGFVARERERGLLGGVVVTRELETLAQATGPVGDEAWIANAVASAAAQVLLSLVDAFEAGRVPVAPH